MIYEELKTIDAKKKFRELVKSYHPDIGGKIETMKKINVAKDVGDKALLKVYKELKEKKPEKKENDSTLLKKYYKWAEEVEYEISKKLRHKAPSIRVERRNGSINVFIQLKVMRTFYLFDVQKKYKDEESFKEAIREKIYKNVKL